MKKKSAFTLVELLVVIGIIAVLIGILLPTLGKAREQARRVACLSNLHQLAVLTAVYSANSKGHIPLGVMDLSAPRINEEYVTNELYLYSGASAVMSQVGVWNGTPLSKMWTCPSSLSGMPVPAGNTVGNPVASWFDLARKAGQGYPANTITAYPAVLSTSYVYCGVGIYLPSGTFTSAANQFNSPGSFVQNYSNLAQNFWVSGSQQVLFADRVSWHYQTGIFANHGFVIHAGTYGNPMTPGLNEVYADGHGAWVNLSNTPLLNAGQAEGPANAASNPVIQFPQTLPLPKGYPAVMHQASWPFYEMWYW